MLQARTAIPGLLLILGVCALPVESQQPQPAQRRAIEAAKAHREKFGYRILAEFAELLALPNVARDLPEMRINAAHIRDELIRRGIEAELWSIDGTPPVVFGSLDVEGASRTLGIYVHYDGQPVDPGEWVNPPWQPTLYTAALEKGGRPRAWPEAGEAIDPEWRIYARSSGDDKAPLAAIFSALDALSEAGITPTSNLRFLFEGEEEAGSDHLGSYMAEHADLLQADLWLICDGPVHQSRRPQLVFGVRGYTGLDITLYGANRYLHSGHYGNWAPNPAQNLARLLASMKDAKGNVIIAGFNDSTAPISEVDREAIANLPQIDDALRSELELAATEGDGAPLVERLLIPSLNIRGLSSAAVGNAARNIIPTQAEVSLDIRLAKGNDPVEMLDLVEAHIQAQGFHIVREKPDRETRLAHARIARVVRREGYPATRSDMDLGILEQVIAAAQLAAGEAPILMPTMGGSLPLYLFTDILEAPLVIVPIANHDDNQHAPNENLRIANLWYGIDLMASLFTLPDNN